MKKFVTMLIALMMVANFAAISLASEEAAEEEKGHFGKIFDSAKEKFREKGEEKLKEAAEGILERIWNSISEFVSNFFGSGDYLGAFVWVLIAWILKSLLLKQYRNPKKKWKNRAMLIAEYLAIIIAAKGVVWILLIIHPVSLWIVFFIIPIGLGIYHFKWLQGFIAALKKGNGWKYFWYGSKSFTEISKCPECYIQLSTRFCTNCGYDSNNPTPQDLAQTQTILTDSSTDQAISQTTQTSSSENDDPFDIIFKGFNR